MLSAIEQHQGRAEELLPLVYGELRRLASARLDQERPAPNASLNRIMHHSKIMTQFSKVLLGIAPLFGTNLSAQVQFTYTTFDYPQAVNGTALTGISGTNIVGNGGGHGLLCDGSTWTTLDDPFSDNPATEVHGISGTNIVGFYLTRSWPPNHGFLYDGSAYTTLEHPLGAEGTVAFGVSGSRVVGNYWDDSGYAHGFLYDGNTWTALDMPGSTGGVAYGISGEDIVGTYSDGGLNARGFFYDGSTWNRLDAPLAGTAWLQGTWPTGVSNGNIVGYYVDSRMNAHGFFYSKGNWTSLDAPRAVTNGVPLASMGTYAMGISGAVIVGFYDDKYTHHGFLASLVRPDLTIKPSGGKKSTIFWPYPSVGWTLVQCPDLKTANWTPTEGVSNDGTNSFLQIEAKAETLFFRLRQD